MRSYTKQEAFNAICAHAALMKEKCIGKKGWCLFRLGDNKCFVGALIADEDYREDLENKVSTLHKGNVIDIVDLEAAQQTEFLQALQIIHDEEPFEEWQAHLSQVALEYKLVT